MSEFKFINLLKNKNLAKILSAGLAVAVLCSVMAIPVSAVQTEWVPVTLTADDLYNMYRDNSLYSLFYVYVEENYVDLLGFDGSSIHLTSEDDPFALFNQNPDSFPCFISDDIFYFFAPYILVGPSSSSSKYTISSAMLLPFSYSFGMVEPSSFYVYSFYTEYDDSMETIVSLNLNDDTVVSSYSSYPFLSEPILWDSNNPLYSIYSMYPDFQPTFRLYNDSYLCTTEFSISSTGFDIFSLSSSVSHSGDTDEFNSQPFVYGISSMTVYVQEEISDPVEEYLDVIAGPPTAENQERINELKQEMQEIDIQLKESADDMAVDVPDISDVESTIPDELTQGNEIVSQQVLSPILNSQPIATIFLGLFAIVSLKLFLFGSGPH